LTLTLKPKDGSTDILRHRPDVTPMGDRGPKPPPDQVAPPWRLLLQIGGENRTTLGVTVTERMLVGREDVRKGQVPEIDLAPFDGAANGVSRDHAVITYDDGALYVEDLTSTNGTRINGFQLTPERTYRLRDGDEIEFGRLRVVLRFVRPAR
jgi:pSer/pThr/pTyr-binding forkhead associated (FHA) protein